MEDTNDNAEGSFKESVEVETKADGAASGLAFSNTCSTEINDKQEVAPDDVDNSSGSGEVSESESNSESVKCEDTADININSPLQDDKQDVVYNQIESEDCDDRSQTPLQDEIESVQNLDNECSNENSVITENLTNEGPLKSPGTKDGAVNDDHGELDYEEDEMMEDGQEKSKVDLDSKASDKDKKPDSEQKTDAKESEVASSDGELADDDDCEEGEIKEPGTKKPFIRPLCRFFTRGNCTWGINCRFLHPGINDKGNYSLIEQQHSFVPPMPPPGMMPMLRGPPPSWVHERFGKRMLPPPRPSELHQPDVEATGAPIPGPEGPATESAWERGLRHAKEIQRKRRDTDGDDKKEKEDSISPTVSPSRGSALPSQLAPPPPRDPYYDDLHRPMPPSIPGRLPLPMPLPPPMHHPEAWPYRHPFEYEMRWHRPPPPEFMHMGFPPIPDMRFMDRERMGGGGRRFSPPLRMDPNNRKDDRMSRYDRYNRTSDVPNSSGGGGGGADSSRGKCEEWKDPWLRTKSPKKKHPSSSRSGSRGRKRSRSKRSYSSFSSSSYSSKSRSRSRSSSGSSSSSRSSFSSRSRSSSKSSKSIPKKVAPVGCTSQKQSPFEKPLKLSDPTPKSVITKVIPPSLADMSAQLSTKVTSIPSGSQQSTTASVGQTSASATASRSEAPKPMMTSLSITLGNKPSSSVSKTNQLQPVGKSVAEAFKDVDDDAEEDVKTKSKMSKLPTIEPNKPVELTTASGQTYKSGIVEGNVSYPIPVKPNTFSEAPKKGLLPPQDMTQKRTPRSRTSSSSSNGSSSSHSRNSHSSSSNSGDSDHIYSDIASPISSDGSISPRPAAGQKMYSDRGNVAPPPRPTESHSSRGSHMFAGDRGRRDIRGGGGSSRAPDFRMERREYRDPYGFPSEPGRMGRKEYRPDQRQEYVGRPDPKFMGRKVTHDVMAHSDPRADNRDHYRSDMRKVDQRADMKSSRQDHSRSGERVSGRMGMHPQLNRRDDRGSQGRLPQEPSGEYRRVVHTGPPTRAMDERHIQSHKEAAKPMKVDARNVLSSKRPVSPHMQRSPKRMRMAPEYKEPVKIPIPKQKFAVPRGGTKTSKENFEDEMRVQSHSSNKQSVPAKVSSKKGSTSSKREELLLQLKAVEDAIAKKRSKNQ